MTVDQLLKKIREESEKVSFEEIVATINVHYSYTPTRFSNGLGDSHVVNEAGQNEGSCRIFAFAKMHGLNQKETLGCFGRFYREDVLGNPSGVDHMNIRNFMRDGWDGLRFDGEVLAPKKQ